MASADFFGEKGTQLLALPRLPGPCHASQEADVLWGIQRDALAPVLLSSWTAEKYVPHLALPCLPCQYHTSREAGVLNEVQQGALVLARLLSWTTVASVAALAEQLSVVVAASLSRALPSVRAMAWLWPSILGGSIQRFLQLVGSSVSVESQLCLGLV